MAVWYIDILGNIVVIQSNCFGEIQTNQSIKKENQGWRNDNNSKKHQTWFLAFVPCGSGRVLNRFSKDIGEMDVVLPWTFVEACQVLFTNLLPWTHLV